MPTITPTSTCTLGEPYINGGDINAKIDVIAETMYAPNIVRKVLSISPRIKDTNKLATPAII